MTAPNDIDERLRLLSQNAFDAATRRGISSLAAWSTFMAEVRRTVNHYRGHEVADLLFLDGMNLREIADLVEQRSDEPLSYQAVAYWLKLHGPTSYLAVCRDGDRYETTRIPVLGTVQTRREVAALRDGGWRIAPASWQAEADDQVQAEALWERLGPRR